MQSLIPDQLVSEIFKLNLQARVIADNKCIFPIYIKGRTGRGEYKVLVQSGEKNAATYSNLRIELKGNVDIEYLKYVGEIKLVPIPREPDYYKMQVLKFYKVNSRMYKRVPYRRAIQIVSPIESEGVLINISGSGAMLQSREKIEGQKLVMQFILLKKNMILEAQIIEQKYDEQTDSYFIRCYFDPIDKKDQKIILQTVKEITMMAKRRLQSK